MNFLEMLHCSTHPSPYTSFLLPLSSRKPAKSISLSGYTSASMTLYPMVDARIKWHDGEREMVVLEINYVRVLMLFCVHVSLLLSM